MKGEVDVSVSSQRSASFCRFSNTTKRDLTFSNIPVEVLFSCTMTFSRRIFYFWIVEKFFQ